MKKIASLLLITAYFISFPQLALAQSDIFGEVTKPAGIEKFDAASNGEIGLLNFVSMLIRLATIVAGLYVLVNLILAGYTYITSSGDASAHTKAKDLFTNSIIGLVVIVSAYTIIALISLVLFGDAGFILNPQLTGPGGVITGGGGSPALPQP